ncbi:23S rRNA methyltransferase [Tsukamurella pulmonis]|uniref:3-oxo-5alpha-steroid 4-dehydrogenase n=1 Tax=Tsukamurella pulmonis TaxID=47312 RepID=A0A1H1B1J9_9ACTN|nr:FAD-binding protein [Tsukamurella pulmonis]KXO94189.1 23S rRNA methyltransferase [Tsukamurella pulmonis]SDQ45787.1 3-oxo-5alpha-steroid 4-dehydrogenase [Tsukamurella pulmonis]SUP25777.1 Fumarate reductase flavoprotein subunit precursor [Tsukamurella pulmonis]
MGEWDLSAEVVVVGYGGAGVVAALAAREAGADVLALDRYLGGGATDLSGGIVYAGGGTWVQRAAGVEDTVENMYAYLQGEVGDAVSAATLRRFCEGSPAMIDWLTGHGVPFQPSLCPYKTSYPTDDYYLYYSGSENSFPDRAVPRQRGHRAHGPGVSGKAFYRPLAASAAHAGVRVRTGTRVRDLVVEDGRVVGVEAVTLDGAPLAVLRRFVALARLSAKPGVYHKGFRSAVQKVLDRIERRHGRTIRIRATSSVILTTGGFIANRAMVTAHRPEFPWDEGLPLGTAADDGSAITMTRALGAAVDKMDHISNWRFIGPPSAFFAGLAVGSDGRRMIDESRYGAALGDALATRPDHRGWLLVDAPLLAEARKQIPQQSTWFQRLQTERLLRLGSTRGATIEEVATRAGIDPGELRATVDAHNRAAETGAPDPLGKPDAVRRPITTGPFTLLDVSFRARVSYPMPILTLGGLVVDEETGAVLRPDGAPVPGLLAAGRASVGVCSNSYVSGLSLADCVFSGRRAGTHSR